MNPSVSHLSERIKREALNLGFDLVGIAGAESSARAAETRAWLASGHHAGMAWLARDPERRLDPARVVAGARSVVVVGQSYAVGPPPAAWDEPLHGRVARYAWGPDYHDVLLPPLMELGRFLQREAGGAVAWRAYVDTGPLPERELAARAGLGFIGRNSLLVTPQFGSLVLLGELLTDVALEPDPPAEEGGALLRAGGREAGCGACRRCLDACPTGAFAAPYVLDAGRCISYQTIEQRGAIPDELRPRMGNWVFGCDVCQEVCPWVRQFAKPGARRFLSVREDLAAPLLTELLALDEAGFRDRFAGTPLARARRRGLLRNACVALGNSGDPAARPALERALHDPEPLIRDHAEWAMGRIRSLY